jgi:hypothetical protein
MLAGILSTRHLLDIVKLAQSVYKLIVGCVFLLIFVIFTFSSVFSLAFWANAGAARHHGLELRDPTSKKLDLLVMIHAIRDAHTAHQFAWRQPTQYVAPFASTSRLPLIFFFASAVMTGMIAQYLLFGASFSRPERLPSLFDNTISEPFIDTCGMGTNVETPYLRPGHGNSVFAQEDVWTRERIDEMILSTKGFLARDWPLHLGWNNVSANSSFLNISVFAHVPCSITAPIYIRSRDAGS